MQDKVTGSWSLTFGGLAILVHGGAGDVAEASRERHAEGTRRAAAAGFAVLEAGGSSLDAVQAAVTVLEDDPVFNAGTGACLDATAHIALDAAVMRGSDLAAGAVCALSSFKNPVAIARAALDVGGPILYAGQGADAFAIASGFARYDEALMITQAAKERLVAVRAGESDGWAGGTVGAVARDAAGHVAAATSTGGKVGKRVGRVGDSPILGAGTYADDECGAISNTGDGEAFMRLCLAKTVLDWMRGGAAAEDAARRGLELAARRARGLGGTIVVTPAGHVAWARTTATMSWAAKTKTAEGAVATFGGM